MYAVTPSSGKRSGIFCECSNGCQGLLPSVFIQGLQSLPHTPHLSPIIRIDMALREHDVENGIPHQNSGGILGDIEAIPVNKNRVVTRPPEEGFRLTFIDVVCLIVNRMIGMSVPPMVGN